MADIQGLLGNPLFNIGTGLLAQSGYSPVPVSMGQALGGAMQYANQRQMEQAQLQQAREQMKQQQARSAAASQLQGLLTPANIPADGMGPIMPSPIATPQGQAQIPGILAQLAPEQAAASLMPKPAEQPRLSTAMNDYMAMNPDVPVSSPEFRQGFNEFMLAQDPSGSALKELQAKMQMIQVEEALRKRDQEEKTLAQERRGTINDTATDLAKLERMAILNDRIRGTFLEAGLPAPDIRRSVASFGNALAGIIGENDPQYDELIAVYDTLQKDINNFNINSIGRFGTGGNITNNMWQGLRDANANLGLSPDANATIIGGNLDAILKGADSYGILGDIKDADYYKNLAESLTQGGRAIDVNTAPIDRLLKLPASYLTLEQKQQLAERMQRESR